MSFLGADDSIMIPSKEFVRSVYTDALGYYEAYGRSVARIGMTPYEFIDAVSRVTGDRLRQLGAHSDSSRWRKTAYLIEFTFFWTGDVPESWLTEWRTALKPFQLEYKAPGQVLFDNIAPSIKGGIKFGLDVGLPVALLTFFAVDAYGESKRAVKRRFTS